MRTPFPWNGIRTFHGVPVEDVPDCLLPADALAVKYVSVDGEGAVDFSNQNTVDGRIVEQSVEMCASVLPLLLEKHEFERSLIASIEVRIKKG